MTSACFEIEGSSSGTGLCIQFWYDTFYMHQHKQSNKYKSFFGTEVYTSVSNTLFCVGLCWYRPWVGPILSPKNSVASLEDLIFQINFNDNRLMGLFLNNRRRKRLVAKDSCWPKNIYELDNTEFLTNSSKCLNQSNTFNFLVVLGSKLCIIINYEVWVT